jgi:acetyl esterase/lipase
MIRTTERTRRSARVVAGYSLLLLSAASALGQGQTVLVWPDGAPGSEGRAGQQVVRLSERGEHIVSGIHAPSLTAYLPKREEAMGAAVIVIPGGGHAELWMDHEGYRVAQVLAEHGIAAFVLKYRLAREKGSIYTVEEHALPDVQRAVRLVRSRAGEWAVDPTRVGVMGFSAGGELAALASTRYDFGVAGSANPVDRVSSRPDFQALFYPSIPQDLKVSKDMPPSFLLCGAADQPAISLGVANLYVELNRAGVPTELHIYAGVGHGFGLRASNQGPVATWPQRFVEWLGAQGFLKRR